jgi:hypothetical protein
MIGNQVLERSIYAIVKNKTGINEKKMNRYILLSFLISAKPLFISWVDAAIQPPLPTRYVSDPAIFPTFLSGLINHQYKKPEGQIGGDKSSTRPTIYNSFPIPHKKSRPPSAPC